MRLQLVYHELSLVDQISKALEARAFEQARALIQQHHDEYPKDYDDLGDGYSRLAIAWSTRPGRSTSAQSVLSMQA